MGTPDGDDWIDPWLGGFLQAVGYDEDLFSAEWGKHKVPTLRNVDKRPSSGVVNSFGPNGYLVVKMATPITISGAAALPSAPRAPGGGAHTGGVLP